jgi:hypothetical protein
VLLKKNTAVAGASVVFIALTIPASVAARSVSAALPLERSPAPPGYSFRLDVAMAMRHFPWLHFHMAGDGVYEPGVSYVVHFTKVPWFVPQGHHDCDLAMLDPLMWPSRYLYEETGERDGNKLFALHAINDPTLREATVAIGPDGSARSADATYIDGTHIESQLTSSNVGGFVLPVKMTATIDEPHLALSANADFKDYDFRTAASSSGASQ